jgi:ABC-type lipoprotein export system ATPase subunit
MTLRAVGSEWGKWDLHFHTPASFDYQDGTISDQQIVDGLIGSGIVAVAITDHHVIDAARIKKLQKLAAGKLTVFPGIELRSELGGKESVHLIGIFPEDADPAFIWTKIQGPLQITPTEVAAKGDDHVYVRFEQAADLIHELGGVVSTHVGRKTNSFENIGNEHPYKRAFKADLAKRHIDLFEIGKTEDAKDYREIVFPHIGFQRPIVVCSDNHNISKYAVKAPCWVKADPVFRAFQQIISDPGERVYIGDLPPSVERVRNNRTKYLRSISFQKVSGSTLNEDWFSGTVQLNPGLVAIIGNKGMGKTALAESIGLLANTMQHHAFTFLSASKFRQPKDNKAAHFEATLEWQDSHKTARKLSESIAADAVESVSYIPQNYLETICNEIHTANSGFDKELKSVIFSHVDIARRLGAETLDQLLNFLTQQIHSRMDQIRAELGELNKGIVELQKRASGETKSLLANMFGEKMRELEAHDKAKPEEVKKPDADPAKQAQMQVIAADIAETLERNKAITAELRETEAANRIAQLRKAVADRVLQRLRNFQLQYDKFVSEARTDCGEIGLAAASLVQIQIDMATPTTIRDEAQASANVAAKRVVELEGELSSLKEAVGKLNAQLEAPDLQYQLYLQNLQDWAQRRQLIFGDEGQVGSINYLQAELKSLDDIPTQLGIATGNREIKLRELYRELQQLVLTYKSLYSPVLAFIEEHHLTSGKFGFGFEASIMCLGLEEQLFRNVNQGRKGSFAGAEEGRKVLKGLIDTADFASESGTVDFVNKLLDYLTHDRRESPSPPMLLRDQLRKGSTEEDVVNSIFSLGWLTPRYSLKWAGKDIEQLSPGERGSLLLIFYLLIDRRDVPLILDHPEENLDNQTVYELLVPCIKEARKKRQVIIVTHNPNLAVVCDADQVIYCMIDKQLRNRVVYQSGSLENQAINQFTIDVLEGTRPAFNQRDLKYQA